MAEALTRPKPPFAPPRAAVWDLTPANGLRIRGETRPHNPTLAAHLVVDAGARHAGRSRAGLPHFGEHRLFSGSDLRPKAQLQALLRDKGGKANAWPGSDTAGYRVSVPQRCPGLALEWLAQLVFHPAFPEHKLAGERQAVISERALYEPQRLRSLRRPRLTAALDRSIHARLFGSAPDDALGDAADLPRFTRAGPVDFHWQRFTPANAGLAVSSGRRWVQMSRRRCRRCRRPTATAWRACCVPERRFLGRHALIFALNNLAAGREDRRRDAERLALLGLSAAAGHFIWQRSAQPGGSRAI